MQPPLKGCNDACGQVVGPLVPKGCSCRPCRSRGQRLKRAVRRRGRCVGRFFLGWDAFCSCHGGFHPRHGLQASPCFFARRVRRRLLVLSNCCVFQRRVGVYFFSCISSARFVHIVVIPFPLPWIPLPSCHSSSLGNLVPPLSPCPFL
jgi:hypothetical protein